MRLAALAAGLSLAVACSSPSAPSAVPLSHTFESAEALATALLARLAARDTQGVSAMALTEAEFRDHVWPELPASQPERNVPFEYAWGQMKQRSDGHLAGILSRYSGRTLTLRRIGFTGETTKYRTFVVQRDSEIVAADDTGREWILRLFGSMLVKDGRCKVFSFVVDD
jgi:hypothetical protein